MSIRFDWSDDSYVYWLESRIESHDGEDWRVSRIRFPRGLPQDWGLIAGDAIHNLRSALDHMVCAFVSLNNKNVTNRHQFPIEPRTPDAARRRVLRDRLLGGVDPGIRNAILRLQPYRRPTHPDSRRLVLLAGMDNADKHRLLLPAVTLVSELDPAHVRAEGPEADSLQIATCEGPLTEGLELFRVRGWHTVVHYLMKMEIAFGERAVTLAEVKEIERVVVGIIDQFAPEFP